jgi:hypothetical protein
MKTPTTTKKKTAEALRDELWSVLGETGSRLLLSALGGDSSSCLVLADYFEEQGDDERARLVRPASLSSLFALLCSLPGLKTVCLKERQERIDRCWSDRITYKTQPSGRTTSIRDPRELLDNLVVWEPGEAEDPDGYLRKLYCHEPWQVKERCLRPRHVSMLFDRGCEGHTVPDDVSCSVSLFRYSLYLLVSKRLLPYMQES